MITLDENKDNSEILEYILKVAYKFCPMVYEDRQGIMHIGGTRADEQFEYYYNKGELNFLAYNDYLSDEEIQANIKEFGLDADKFYLLILFITHCAKGAWENPNIEITYPHTQVESFCDTIMSELKSISDNHAEFINEATITLKIGKKKVVVNDSIAVAYIGTMVDKMYDMVKATRKFHSQGYKTDFAVQEEKSKMKDTFYNQLNALASPNVYTYYDENNKKAVTINYNEALFSKALDSDAPFEKALTYQTYLIGYFATMLEYFFRDYGTPVRKSFVNQRGKRITISKYRIICRLIGLTKLTQNKKLDNDFLEDEGDKVKGYVTALKKAKIKIRNRFYN